MERKAYVDFAKCLAIFFVLSNHIGLIIPGISSFGGMFYVPIFFLLSGYTYHSKEESYVNFAKKKAKRLLIPYFVANLIYFVLFLAKDFLTRSIGSASFFPLLGILYSRYSLYPPYPEFQDKTLFFLTIQNSPTWFLTALFLTYLLFETAVRIAKRYRTKKAEVVSFAVSAGLCLLLGTSLHYGCPVLLPWSLECIPLFMLYMLSGYLLQKQEICRKLWESRGVLPYLYVLLLGVVVWLGYRLGGSANVSVGNFGGSVVLGLLNGITSSMLVLTVSYRLNDDLPRSLCIAGKYTLHLLCYHLLLFLPLEICCNLLFPGMLQEQTVAGMLLKLFVIVVTMALLVLADHKLLPCLENKCKNRQ